MAKRAEPWVSPTKRIPSGPNPSGPADLIWGLPCFRLAVGSPAPAETAIMIAPAIASAAARVQFLGILSSPWLRIEMSRVETRLRMDVAALWPGVARFPY